MSTRPPVPPEPQRAPLTAEQWVELYTRSERTRRRSKRAQLIAVVAGVLVVGLFVGVGLFAFSFKDVPGLQRSQTATLSKLDQTIAKVDQVVSDLQQAEGQRQCASAQTSQAFATVLNLLGDAFATPPAPDPDRLKAVQGFRDAANKVTPANPPPNCPGS